jgi:hypothetical protein
MGNHNRRVGPVSEVSSFVLQFKISSIKFLFSSSFNGCGWLELWRPAFFYMPFGVHVSFNTVRVFHESRLRETFSFSTTVDKFGY